VPSKALLIDSLVGLSVGDAVGAAAEGQLFDPDRDAPPGRHWTDDTQMAVSVAEVLLEHGRVDQDRLARAFALRYEPWRGYGAGMHALLRALRGGDKWQQARFIVFPSGSFGNGSAMRVAPLGAFLAEASRYEVVAEAARSAEVTHAHPEGIAGAVAVAVAAWTAARSRGEPAPTLESLLDGSLAALSQESEVARGLAHARGLAPGAPLARAVERLGNGSRVACADTVPLALWLAFTHLDDYRGAVEAAVKAGGDADTVAAIAGGIVAARVGKSAIPAEWLAEVEPLPLDFSMPGS
jgi:ADP-ribosylglycohydrolase